MGNAKKIKNILIVGDWFVDEHWVAGIHRSSTSSRTGEAHFRALHKIDSTVQSFCGAGKVASLLYNTKEEQFFIYGVGLWHNDDTEILEAMLDPNNLIGKNLFRLKQSADVPPPDKVKLINLSDLVRPEEKGNIATTRIIRIYNILGSNEIRYQRLDWEIRHESETYTHLFPEQAGKPHFELIYKFQNMLKKRSDNTSIDAIIIKDLCKGVISRDMIRLLARNFEKASWFVSTKAWNPDWYEDLKTEKVNLRLLLIPQVPAQEAIRRGELSCWITRRGYPGENAIKLLKKLRGRVCSRNSKPEIIILPDGYSVLAYSTGIKDKNLSVQTVVKQKDLMLDMGMASAFLPALVANMLKPGEYKQKSLVEEALQATFAWTKYDSERVTNREKWSPKKKFMDKADYKTIGSGDFKIQRFNLKEEGKKWSMAMKDIGVIEIPSENSYFDLSRAMVEIDGYACFIEEKRKEIGKLTRGIQSFLDNGKKHHVSCMLTAGPGSGKTFLVRRLAETSNLRFLPFNITQMIFRKDILEIFDSIVTTQAQEPNKAILVFIDEINAELEGNYVHSSFLAPIEEGVYIREGKPFFIDPCIWVFSGTSKYKPSKSKDVKKQIKEPKESDFISRLSLGILDLEKGKNSYRKNIENIYVGISLILNEYPDVRYVTKQILEAFKVMPKQTRIRELKHFVKSFRDIQCGELRTKNIPEESFYLINGSPPKDWGQISDENKVEIMT